MRDTVAIRGRHVGAIRHPVFHRWLDSNTMVHHAFPSQCSDGALIRVGPGRAAAPAALYAAVDGPKWLLRSRTVNAPRQPYEMERRARIGILWAPFHSERS